MFVFMVDWSVILGLADDGVAVLFPDWLCIVHAPVRCTMFRKLPVAVVGTPVLASYGPLPKVESLSPVGATYLLDVSLLPAKVRYPSLPLALYFCLFATKDDGNAGCALVTQEPVIGILRISWVKKFPMPPLCKYLVENIAEDALCWPEEVALRST